MSWDHSAPEWERRSRPDRQSLIAGRKRAATVGIALLVTSVVCGASNVGMAVMLGAVQRANPRKDSPPSWVRKEDRASWERGRVAAPGFQLCCAGVISLAIYLPVFLGGLRLQQGGGWGLGLTAAIMAMFPCSPGFLLGLPMGIWALTVLSNSEVKDALGPRRKPRRPHRFDDED